MSQPSRPPRWETAVLGLSFVLLWAWWLAHQAALRVGARESLAWQVALGAAVVLLVVVMVRRFARVRAALREVHPASRGHAGRN